VKGKTPAKKKRRCRSLAKNVKENKAFRRREKRAGGRNRPATGKKVSLPKVNGGQKGRLAMVRKGPHSVGT